MVRYTARLSDAEARNTRAGSGWPRAIPLFGTVGPIYIVADGQDAWRQAERIGRRDDQFWKTIFAVLWLIAGFTATLAVWVLSGTLAGT